MDFLNQRADLERPDHHITNDLAMVSRAHLILDDVSIICTVYNEADSIIPFLSSLTAMSCLPEEFIVVDGGSSDHTPEIIDRYFQEHPVQGFSVKVLVDTTCNIASSVAPIAKGRNIAIRNSSKSIIACVDAGCIMVEDWLCHIVKPFKANCDANVVGGWYVPEAHSFFERCSAEALDIPTDAVDPKTFLPSSRSFAFRKEAWARVGGYPELSFKAEDTWFVIRLREAGYEIIFEPQAIVRWRMRPSLPSLLAMSSSYGFGDGSNRLLIENLVRNLAKFSLLGLLWIPVFTMSYWFLVLPMLYLWLAPYARKPRRAMRFKSILLSPLVGTIKLTTEAAYVVGYVGGWVKSVSIGRQN